MRVPRFAAALSIAATTLAAIGAHPAPAAAATSGSSVTVSSEVHHDTSPALRDMTDLKTHGTSHPAIHSQGHHPDGGGSTKTSVPGTPVGGVGPRVPSTSANFDGIANDPDGVIPPDDEVAAGPSQIVEVVNSHLAVYGKTGGTLLAPETTNTLWSGFGGLCQTDNDGDATVLYDTLAGRWFVQQFAVSGTSTAYLDCLAVSTSSDATGTWNRYSFGFGATFPDYPKTGVWPDAYYASYNLFNAAGTAALGNKVCAFNRANMLSGAASTMQCFQPSTSGEQTYLPATIDGTTTPASGTPEWFIAISNNANALSWLKFHVDWTTPANSNITAASDLAVNAFSEACGGGTCIPQAGVSTQLDSLADRLMYRFAYRNRGGTESLVVSHSITAGSSVGERWYELRPSGGSLTVFQQGTYAPDSTYRWMGSIAMDSAGDMALGYSTSSASLHPGVAYTGRLVGDPAGTMPQGENTIITGAGSQTGGGLNPDTRWGDYSEMSVDPADDCTFWYMNEYIPANGDFNWSTRIGSFKFPSCGSTTNDFSISASPTSLSLAQNTQGTSTISTAVTSGSAGTVSLSVSGTPSGATATLNPTSVTAGGSSTLTVNAGTAAAGTYTLTVTGTEGTATHSTSVSLTVTAPPANDFSISASPTSVSVNQGASGTSTISTAVTSGSAQTVSLSASGAPGGVTASFNPTSVTAGGSSTLTLSSTNTTAPGTYTITVTGTGTSATHSTSVSLTVVADNFSISASPTSVAVTQGNSGTSTISTALVSGSAQSISLSAGGLPSGATATFNPTSVTTGGSSTLTLATAASTPAGTYTVTVTGTAPSTSHSTTVSLTVNGTGGGPVVTNGGFETGTFSGWTTGGAATSIVSSGAHSGTYAARLGSTSPTNGDSFMQQQVNVPAGSPTLTFWYQPHCPDTITYDQEQMQVRSTSGSTLVTVLNVCSNGGAWTQVSQSLSAYAGTTVVLWFNNHDDNYSADPTYTLFDDVAISVPGPNVVTNGGFETGSFSGWTTSGQSETVVPTAHSGTYAAELGLNTATNGDSTMQQTVSVPAGSPTLTFWYQPHCPDTITYDQEQMQVRSTSGTVLATVLNACSNSGAWTKATFSMAAYAGTNVVLWFNNHDDNYPTDATYTLFDDISLQ